MTLVNHMVGLWRQSSRDWIYNETPICQIRCVVVNCDLRFVCVFGCVFVCVSVCVVVLYVYIHIVYTYMYSCERRSYLQCNLCHYLTYWNCWKSVPKKNGISLWGFKTMVFQSFLSSFFLIQYLWYELLCVHIFSCLLLLLLLLFLISPFLYPFLIFNFHYHNGFYYHNCRGSTKDPTVTYMQAK